MSTPPKDEANKPVPVGPDLHDELLGPLLDAVHRTARNDRRIKSLLTENGMEDEWSKVLGFFKDFGRT